MSKLETKVYIMNMIYWYFNGKTRTESKEEKSDEKRVIGGGE